MGDKGVFLPSSSFLYLFLFFFSLYVTFSFLLFFLVFFSSSSFLLLKEKLLRISLRFFYVLKFSINFVASNKDRHMVYKGREITVEQVTTSMVREIIQSQFFTLQRMTSHRYRYVTWGYTDKDTIFDYGKVLEAYKKYLNHPRSKPPIDLETGILNIVKECSSNLLTDALLEHRKRKEEQWVERKRQSRNPTIKPAIQENPQQFNTGIVKLPLTQERQSYSEQLEDIRWTAFRTFVFVVKGQKCEQCGSTHYINLHHTKYIPGRSAWEYTCNEVQVLCRECHEKIHNIKKDIGISIDF